MLGSKFVKFLKPILKRQVHSSPNFVSLFNLMKNNSSVTFISNNVYFAQKQPIKVKIFETFESSGQIYQIPYGNFETTSRFLSKFCISLQFHERQLLCTFLSQTIYTLLKSSLLKWKFLRLLNTRVKICQILYINFEMTSWFLSKIPSKS